MKKTLSFSEMFDGLKDSPAFKTEEAILDFTEKLCDIMKEKGISRADLAVRLGVSRAYVTKLLNGNPNLTLKSFVAIADAVGCEFRMDMCPVGSQKNVLYVGGQAVNDDQFTEEYTPSATGEADNGRAA
jgi:transcriptional regulator with XRE-family HTH domain